MTCFSRIESFHFSIGLSLLLGTAACNPGTNGGTHVVDVLDAGMEDAAAGQGGQAGAVGQFGCVISVAGFA